MPGSKISYGVLSGGSSELAEVARFLVQPSSSLAYAVVASWVGIAFLGQNPAIQSTFQVVVAKGTDGTSFACYFYNSMSLPSTTYNLWDKGMTGFANKYTLPGGRSGAAALSVANTSGGWYQIGQQARPGTWCFTVHQACAARPEGCPVVYPSTCGANTVPMPVGSLTSPSPCTCTPGFYVRPGTDIGTQGCVNRTADCISGAACPGMNSYCDWQSGANACRCRAGWQVAPGEALDVQGCSRDVDECMETSNCVAPNTVCSNNPGNYSCTCAPGYVLAPGTDARIHGCVLPSCATPPAQPIARGTWACNGPALQSGDSCAATCNDGFIGAPMLACTSAGTYAAIASEQCTFNNSAGLPEFFLTINGSLASFPPLSDATLVMFATHIASGLNLPPPYSVADLVAWFEHATLDVGTCGGQHMLQLVVGYAAMPEAARSIPLLAVADSPATLLSIADGLHSASSFISSPGATLVITASDAAGRARGTAVPISADCTVSLVAPDAEPSVCAGNASVSASFRFSGRRVQGATTFTASLGGNVCTPPPAPLQGSQMNAAVLVGCSTPSTVGVHNLSVAATYTADGGCASGMVAAQTTVRVYPVPTVTLMPALASVLVCAGSNATLEFTYTVTLASADEPLQLLPSVSGLPATCSVVKQGTNQAGKLVITCSGSFGPQAAPVAVTATLTATAVTGCSASASATATVNGLCCKVAGAVAYAGVRGTSTCFHHLDPTDVRCRARPPVSRYGWVNKGPLKAGILQPDLTSDSCATTSAAVGSVSARCRESDGALVFTVSTSRLSSARLRYWVGCSPPAASAVPAAARTTRLAAEQKAMSASRGLRAVQACNQWRQLPALGTNNAVELSVNTDATTSLGVEASSTTCWCALHMCGCVLGCACDWHVC